MLSQFLFPSPATLRFFATQLSTPFTIYFGSQSGTSQSFAYDLGDEFEEHGYENVTINDISTFDSEVLDTSIPVFLLSCFGEGEPTPSAEKFYFWLKNNPDSLEHVNYAIFGCGNGSLYPERYQAVSRHVVEFFDKSGAGQIISPGEGDAGGDIDEDFEEWYPKLFDALKQGDFKVGKHSSSSSSPTVSKPQKNENERGISCKVIQNSVIGDHPYQSKLVDDFVEHQTTHNIIFETPDLEYTTGDHLGVYPKNNISSVSQFLSALKLDPNFILPGFSQTLEQLFLSEFDIFAPVRASSLPLLNVSSQNDREFLNHLEKGKHSHLIGSRGTFTYLDLANNLDSFSIKPETIPRLFPKLTPRFYSISSSSKTRPQEIQITVSKVEYTNNHNTRVFGPGSTYLCQLIPGQHTDLFVRPSKFRLTSENVPIVMVGAGTGIAPFYAFLEELVSDSTRTAPFYLYFGCYNAEEDFLYKDQLLQWEKENPLFNLVTAFSDTNTEKPYVQHHMINKYRTLWDYMNSGAYFYVCGNADTIARATHNTLFDICHQFGNMTLSQSREFIQNLTKERRYQQDIF